MRSYELTYLISPDLSEEELNVFQEKINSLIQGEDGILDQRVSTIKKKLGYLVRKKSMAFLGEVDFHLAPEKIENLEKKLKAEGQILRYMILTKEAPKIIEVPKKRLKVIKKIEKPKKEKVELKEIEKKLEEILGET